MTYALIILFVVILLQDMWFRGIYWFLFPAVLFLSVWINHEVITYERLGFNVLFLTILLAALTLYLSLKKHKLINITNGYFSWGDILFLLAVVPLFEPYVFIIFFTTGTLVALLLHIGASLFAVQKTVPYAGYMALSAIVFLLFAEQIQHVIYQI